MKNRPGPRSPYRHTTRIIEPPSVVAACLTFALAVGALAAGNHILAAGIAGLYFGFGGRVGGRAPSGRTHMIAASLFTLTGAVAFEQGRPVVGTVCAAGFLISIVCAFVASGVTRRPQSDSPVPEHSGS